MKRWRRPKLFRVTRVEQIQVTFFVEATSALKARHTPTPASARRAKIGETVGEAAEQVARWRGSAGWAVNGLPIDYSVADDEHGDRHVRNQVTNSIGRDYSRSTSELPAVDGDLVEQQFADPRFR